MADRKITDLTEITAPSADDVLHLIDFNPSARNTKITLANFFSFIPSNTTFGASGTPCDITIYGSNINANQMFTSANDTHTFNCNTFHTRAVSIGDGVTYGSIVMDHYGTYSLRGEANLVGANTVIGATGAGNGKKLEVYGNTGHISFDAEETTEIMGVTNMIGGTVSVGNSTVGQSMSVYGQPGVGNAMYDSTTTTQVISKPAQIVANTTGALYVQGATQLGDDTGGNDVKIMGSGAASIYFDSATNDLHANIASTTFKGNFNVGDGAFQYDVSLHGAAGNTFWDGSQTKLTVNGATNANGLFEVGQLGAGFNATINGSNGARGLFWNATNDTMTANVADSDGFTVHGSSSVGADGVAANATWYSATAGESLHFNGTDREMTYKSTSTEGFIIDANCSIGASDSADSGLHVYGPNKVRFDTVPVIVGNSSVVTALSGSSGELNGTLIFQTRTVGTGNPDATLVAAATQHTQAYIHARQDGGVAELFVMDSNGVETRISSHTHDDEHDYEIHDRVAVEGGIRHRKINMIKLARALEKVTGETLIEEYIV